MEERYKEWVIKYVEMSKHPFTATKGDVEISGDALKNIKKSIDNYKKKEFKRIPIYYEGWDEYCEGEVTSVARETEDGYPKEVWISYHASKSGKNRTKVDFGSTYHRLYKHNDNNKSLIAEINLLEEQRKQLNGRISEIASKLEKLTVEDIKKAVQE